MSSDKKESKSVWFDEGDQSLLWYGEGDLCGKVEGWFWTST